MHIFEAPEAQLDPTAQHIKEAAEARNIPTITKISQKGRVLHVWTTFKIGTQEFFYTNSALKLRTEGDQERVGPNINHGAALLIADKHAAKEHLAEKGFSVPKGQFFRRRKIEQAYAAFDTFSGPICVKPNNGLGGRGVFTSITDEKWFKVALDEVAKDFPNILVEESVSGEHLRFMYVEPKVVGIRNVRPANVTGDGASSVLDLIHAKNEVRKQLALPSEPPLEVDQDMRDFLERTGRSLSEVPAQGERVFLRGVGGSARGSDSDVIWEEVHPSYREIVEQACLATPGLVFSGVDMVVEDYSVPANPDNYWLLELNASPTFSFFHHSRDGRSVDVAGHIVDLLIKRYS